LLLVLARLLLLLLSCSRWLSTRCSCAAAPSLLLLLLFLPLLLLLLLLLLGIWVRAEPLAVNVAQLDQHTAGKHTPSNCRCKGRRNNISTTADNRRWSQACSIVCVHAKHQPHAAGGAGATH
jgi:hypothetical protein